MGLIIALAMPFGVIFVPLLYFQTNILTLNELMAYLAQIGDHGFSDTWPDT